MKGIESGKDKVKKICDVLKKETLEPAKAEAEQIVEKARIRADELIGQAHQAIEKMQIEAQGQIDRQRKIFESSLSQACKQALEGLKQEIEERLFNQELLKMIEKQTQVPQVIGELITAVVRGIEKEGIDAKLSAYISAAVPARSVNALLMKNILERLSEKGVLVGSLEGGIQVKMHENNITLDLSSSSLFELVSRYVRKDFRELLFGKT